MWGMPMDKLIARLALGYFAVALCALVTLFILLAHG
jgi:hypothetical protein